MSAARRELPMAPAGCALDRAGLGEQLDRYRRLGATATGTERSELGIRVRFSADVDLALLRETIAIERGCCTFLTLVYDASDRWLSITVDDPARVEALDLLSSALTRAG